MPNSLWVTLIIVACATLLGALALRHQCIGFNCSWSWLRHRLEIETADERSTLFGTLVPDISGYSLNEAGRWKPWLVANNQGDKDWDWRDHLLDVQGRSAFFGWRFESHAILLEGELLGLMILRSHGCESRLPGSSAPIVYVEYLAVAPHCRRASTTRKYRHVGQAMLAFAIHRSRVLGLAGRVGLHSLPGSEDFYRGYDMVDLGPDPSEDGFHYFEMPPE